MALPDRPGLLVALVTTDADARRSSLGRRAARLLVGCALPPRPWHPVLAAPDPGDAGLGEALDVEERDPG